MDSIIATITALLTSLGLPITVGGAPVDGSSAAPEVVQQVVSSSQDDTTPAADAGNSSDTEAATTEGAHTGMLQTGKLAVNRFVYEQEESAGHKLFNLTFKDGNIVDVALADTYSADTDAAILKELLNVIELNGFTAVTNY